MIQQSQKQKLFHSNFSKGWHFFVTLQLHQKLIHSNIDPLYRWWEEKVKYWVGKVRDWLNLWLYLECSSKSLFKEGGKVVNLDFII